MKRFSVILILATLFAFMPLFAEEKVEPKTDNNYYVVTLELKQVHYTLSITEHLKDSMNKVQLEIPVDKDYYNSLNVGDRIVDNFRMGSLLLNSSFGDWRITVVDKRIVAKY